MKVGIITFNSAHNYGAVLQAWALQEYLGSSGHEVEVINYRLPAIDNVYRLFEPEKPYREEKKNQKHQQKQYNLVKKENPEKIRAFQRFEDFIANQLHTTKAFYSYEELKNAEFDYDAMIVGSDQVWNTGFTRGINRAYLLEFGPEQARRISYAASRGDTPLTDQGRIIFERSLAKFDFISVREENVAEEIAELTDCNVAVTADPTFLVSREKFDTVRKPYPCAKPYIYVHNVHVKRMDDRLCATAEELSKRTGLPVVTNRRDPFDYSNHLADASDIGPCEFLDVVANAEYIVTNSFHATVFSMIYHKTFITIPSLRNPERMVKLLGRLEVSDHLLDDPSLLPDDLDTLQIDYEKLEQRKAGYAKESKEFLQEALRDDYVRQWDDRHEKSYLTTGNPAACYGCGACLNTAMQNTEGFCVDREGFVYPAVNAVSQENGTEKCLLRQKQLESFDKLNCYQTIIRMDDPAKTGFYGSELQPFCETFLKQGGVVVAKVMTGKTAEYRILRDREDLLRLYAGCFVEVNICEAVVQCKKALEEGKKVLFAGSVCEITAVRMQIAEEQLLTLALECRGVVSDRLFQRYVRYLEQQYESELCELSFVNRIRGWKQAYFYARFSNEVVSLCPATQNAFFQAYRAGKLCRPSCYQCIYAEKWSKAVDLAVMAVPGESTQQGGQLSCLVAVGSSAGNDLLCNTGLETEQTNQKLEQLFVKPFAFSSLREKIMEAQETLEISELLSLK